MKQFYLLISILGFSFNLSTAMAGVKGKSIEYKAGTANLEGYLAMPSKTAQGAPGVLIVHDWMGLADSNKEEADSYAQKGYIAFAVDMYGKNIRPKNTEEASQLSGSLKADRKVLRERIMAAYDVLKKTPGVNSQKIVILGYCFGGTTSLELGRAGAPLAGIISFHGGLENPTPADAKNIKGKVLVLHGAIDPYVSMKEVEAFEKEMNEAKVDYQLIKYSGAVHAFSVKAAGNDISKGAAYDAKVDRRARQHVDMFLKEIL